MNTEDAVARAPTPSQDAIRPANTRFNKIWGMVRYWGIHVAVVVATLLVEFKWSSVALAATLYAMGMFGVTAGYHRYFSHRAFKTSRAFQLVLAWLAICTMQQGVLWWASHHRQHHRVSDKPADVHSPVQHGFLEAHIGWFWNHRTTDVKEVTDFLHYPELRWLDRHYALPGTFMAALCMAVGGWPALVGWGWAAVLVWHCTFTINSLCHMWGTKRFDTRDESRNNLLLALLTFGEGWHNNHHHYQSAARCGFRWWELDLSYLILRALAALGIVWDLREPPARLMRG